MTTKTQLPVADRILQLFQKLGIERAHVAAAMPGDWQALAASSADRLASLSLVCPSGFESSIVAALASRVLVFHGDQGPTAERVRMAVSRLPAASLVTLADYAGLLFADPAVERGDAIEAALLDFLQRMEQKHPTAMSAPAPGAEEVAGISYRIQGSGPPLVLLPLGLAPSQWEPLLPRLGKHFCTIILGGPHLGIIPILESRGQSLGYVRIVRNVLDEIALRPGETVLEVGGGSGAMVRWLAHHTGLAHPITAVDINRYLLQEARVLVQKAGLQDVVTLREGNGEALPFSENSFDVTLSFTVIEEGDADRMLAELVRVTRPGGRVAVIVRGEDWPTLFTLPLRIEVEAKAGRATGAGAVKLGCADGSLYRRFHAAGLTSVRKLPQLAIFDDPRSIIVQNYQSRILSALTRDEADEWNAAVAQAEVQGAFVLAKPHHCAVGTKP